MDDDDDNNDSKKHTLDSSNEITYRKVTIKMKLNQIQPRRCQRHNRKFC